MQPNWFLGLPVRDTSWLTRLSALPPGIRAFAPLDLHATIAFLGPVGEAAALAAWEELRWPLGPTPISFGAVVPLGPPERYSALSALFASGRVPIEEAIGATRERAWAIAGARADNRPPKAHVTLARPSARAPEPARTAGLAWARAQSLTDVHVVLDTVALYTWSTDRNEGLFTIVRRRDL